MAIRRSKLEGTAEREKGDNIGTIIADLLSRKDVRLAALGAIAFGVVACGPVTPDPEDSQEAVSGCAGVEWYGVTGVLPTSEKIATACTLDEPFTEEIRRKCGANLYTSVVCQVGIKQARTACPKFVKATEVERSFIIEESAMEDIEVPEGMSKGCHLERPSLTPIPQKAFTTIPIMNW